MQAKDLVRLPVHRKSAPWHAVKLVAPWMRRPSPGEAPHDEHPNVGVRWVALPHAPVMLTATPRASAAEQVGQESVRMVDLDDVAGEVSPRALADVALARN